MAKENNVTKKVENVDVQKHFEEKAVLAEKAKADNNAAPKVSLTDRIFVEFTKDVGFIKKGAKLSISQVAFDLYDKQKAVEKL